jgi:FkbM family methyltransferase
MKSTLKKLYQSLPFKQEIFKIIRLLKPPQSLYQHLHFQDVIDVKVDHDRSFKIMHYGYSLENDIFWSGLKGNYDAVSISLWLELSKTASVIFDIGANTGIYSLMAKCVNPEADIHVFEPVKRTFEKLQKNFALNNYNVTVVQKAASNQDGKALIGDDVNEEHQYGATLNPNFITGKTYEIETITLNTYIKEKGIMGIDLMKIDVEAFEPEVLQGFSEYLFQFKPSILMEVVQDEPAKRLTELLKGSNYLFFNINEKNGARQVDVITKSDNFNFLICVPEVAKRLGLTKS